MVLTFPHRSPVGKGWQSVKLSRFAALKVRIFPDAPIRFRICDCGLRISKFNPKSEFTNPKSQM